MPIDLNANPANVNPGQPDVVPMLRRLQANILKHHGRQHALHVFLRFSPHDLPALKAWIRGLNITSALKQLEDAVQRKAQVSHDGGMVRLFLLTNAGCTLLGLKAPESRAFQQGMAARQNELNDPGQFGWEHGFSEEIHALLILADSDKSRLEKELTTVEQQVRGLAGLVKVQWGQVLKNADGIGIEHNGYADGISQPIYLETELSEYLANQARINGQFDPTRPDQGWNPAAPLSLVLVADPAAPEGLDDCFGSFLVFRKLEQNVRKFKAQEAALAAMLPKHLEELAGALAVGRFEDGTPVSLSKQALQIRNDKDLPNDFTYSDEKDQNLLRCPFHAHIRKTNPRQAGLGGEEEDKQRRLTRRGIPYDEIGRTSLDEFPEGGVGLLFMAYQSDIERQFEFIQQQWVNNPGFPQDDTGNDPILGQNLDPSGLWSDQNHNWQTAQAPNTALASAFQHHFHDTVRLKGGGYFYAPSLPALQHL